jgi:hypothetical protein
MMYGVDGFTKIHIPFINFAYRGNIVRALEDITLLHPKVGHHS